MTVLKQIEIKRNRQINFIKKQVSFKKLDDKKYYIYFKVWLEIKKKIDKSE